MRRLAYSTLIVCTVVSVSAGFGRWLRPAAPDTPPPLLAAPADRLDFGEVWEDQRLGWVVPLTNTGSAPVRVGAVRTSCGCTAATPTAFRIDPGQTHPLRLAIDLTP